MHELSLVIESCFTDIFEQYKSSSERLWMEVTLQGMTIVQRGGFYSNQLGSGRAVLG